MFKLKKSMSGLDIRICLGELTRLAGSWTGKIYEMDGTFLLKLNTREEGRRDLIIEPGRRIHLTSMKYDTPQKPTSFAMLMRKRLKNSRLEGIEQPDLERVVKLGFEGKEEKFILVSELFGAGNLILCDGKENIISPYKSKTWQHRKIKSGNRYLPPPKKGRDISSISREDLGGILSQSSEVVIGLANNLNIGGPLAEEICARAKIEKKSDPEALSVSEIDQVYGAVEELLSEEPSPQIVYEGGEPISVNPFSFESLEDYEKKKFESFNEALDEYFRLVSRKALEDKREDRFEDKRKSLGSRLEEQKRHLERAKENRKRRKREADAISTHHEKVDDVLENLKRIGKSRGWESLWKEIDKAADSGEDWAEIVESVDPNEGTVTLKLPETVSTLDLRRTAFENASELYEEYKKSKGKIEGVKKAIKETERELKGLEKGGLDVSERKAPKKTREKSWFERYRWFKTADNLLVIAGRDVKTNQEVVEKHMESSDRYLHADLKGSPHTIVKSEGDEISEEAIEEAARFAAMHSRAWRRGLANADVYWVKPDQVTKEAPAGEYLPKGSYMIKGERNYLTVPLEACVGLIEEEGKEILMCGPSSAVRAHSRVQIRIKPGSMKKSKLAHEIRDELREETDGNLDLDELMRVLPPGSGMIVG